MPYSSHPLHAWRCLAAHLNDGDPDLDDLGRAYCRACSTPVEVLAIYDLLHCFPHGYTRITHP